MESLADTLKKATEINNFNEITKIVMELNNTQFKSYKDLVKLFSRLIDEFDPVDRSSATAEILSMVRPDIRELLDPVNVIVVTSQNKKQTCRCFG